MSVISSGQAILLGIVEGLTEFLPVSSTGHLKITESLLDIPVDDDAVVAFTAIIQVGAIAAVLLYFRSDIFRIVTAWCRGVIRPAERQNRDYRFGWWVIAATLPIVFVGLAAKPLIDGPLASLWVVAGSLIAGSGLLWLAEKYGNRSRTEEQAGFVDCFVVGVAQILALLFPGVSRSGASMSVGLLRNLDRVTATKLSFFLGIPALTGAGIYELKDAIGSGLAITPLIIGTAVSFVVAYASIAWLLRFVSSHSFKSFVYYRVAIGIVLFGLLAGNVISS